MNNRKRNRFDLYTNDDALSDHYDDHDSFIDDVDQDSKDFVSKCCNNTHQSISMEFLISDESDLDDDCEWKPDDDSRYLDDTDANSSNESESDSLKRQDNNNDNK
jgi:hypothetical protein